VPYPFAHPAAVLPLARPMGRFAVPSALAIGSVLPDAWYLVPFLDRAETHSVAGLFWFCLPAGLALYLLFHRVLKQPLIALLSPRLGSFTSPGLPAAPWHAVIVSLFVGALTHLAWDALTHSDDHAVGGHNWFQHANTAAGTAILGWWIWRKLRRAPPAAAQLSVFARVCTIVGLIAAMAISALWAADTAPVLELRQLRYFLRTAGIGALEGLAAAGLVYCVWWRLNAKRVT
jgi:hypothetical protein